MKNDENIKNMFDNFTKTMELSLKILDDDEIEQYRSDNDGSFPINPAFGSIFNEIFNPDLETAEFEYTERINIDFKNLFKDLENLMNKMTNTGFINTNSFSKWRLFFVQYPNDILVIKGQDKEKINIIKKLFDKYKKETDMSEKKKEVTKEDVQKAIDNMFDRPMGPRPRKKSDNE